MRVAPVFSPLPAIVAVAGFLFLLPAPVAAEDAVAVSSPAALTPSATTAVDVPTLSVSTTPISAAPAPPLDAMHEKISRAFVTPIAWFDGFFFTEREEKETNRSYMRLIVGYDWINRSGFRFRRAVRVKVRVPGMKEKLNLIFSDEDEAEFEEAASVRRAAVDRGLATAQISRGNPAVETARENRRRAGLGYNLFDWLESRVDLETAMRSGGRGELALKFRQRFRERNAVRSRLSVDGFWLQDTGFGSKARLNIERPVGTTQIFHFDNALTQIHDVDGVVYDSRISHDIKVSGSAGLSPGFGFSGISRPLWRIEAYQLSVLYRQQFFREWLFYEVEPSVNWSRDAFGAYPPIIATSVRLEVQFRKSDP